MCALITLTKLLWFSFTRLLNGPGVLAVASHPRKRCLTECQVLPIPSAQRIPRRVESDVSQETPCLEYAQSQRSGRPELTSGKTRCSRTPCTLLSLSSPRNGAEAVLLNYPQHRVGQGKLRDKHKLLFRHSPLQVQHGSFSATHNKRALWPNAKILKWNQGTLIQILTLSFMGHVTLSKYFYFSEPLHP